MSVRLAPPVLTPASPRFARTNRPAILPFASAGALPSAAELPGAAECVFFALTVIAVLSIRTGKTYQQECR